MVLMWLQIKMYLILSAFFGILYMLLVLAGSYLGIGSFILYGIIASVLIFIQYMIGPKMVEWSMQVRYVSEKEYPELHRMVADAAKKAGIPKPKVGISKMPLPNAFAFGRWASDARVCVTEQIMSLLSKDELKAVIGHEVSHIKNRDVLIITLISVIPTIAWYIAWNFMYSRDEREGSSNFALGIAAFAIYMITNLLVLYASRIREYYADKGSVSLGNRPSSLASALYKLVYGSAKTPRSVLRQAEGMKAFFANDPSRALQEFQSLASLDMDKSGTIDESELRAIRNKKPKISGMDRFMELLSTHPNMVKRISELSKLN